MTEVPRGQALRFWAGFAACLPQAAWVRGTAPRFPGAEGPRHGTAGEGPTRRLVALGDSIVDGVGCGTLDRAMTGRTAAALAEYLGCRIAWSAHGRSGATTADIRDRWLPDADLEPADYVVVSTGVNDLISLRSLARFRADLGGLLDGIRKRAPDAVVAMLGLPPIETFPALPRPLRDVLAMRAGQLDHVLRAGTEDRSGVAHVAVRFPPADGRPDPRFAADGFHPSESACIEIGRAVAERLIELRGRL
ncbi:MAG: SGNH/GDSL hydrolase family protein [Wenzhouxiangellaceae bacterium]|nr:SGNH/GDSL hydrolase family protein [Wenzhouxiangellaceae bacterium]